MPLPVLLIVGAAALVAGGVGVAKGIQAKNRFDEATDIDKDASKLYDEAIESLERCRDETQSALEKLGEEKASLVSSSLIPFVEAFERLKGVDYREFETSEECLANIESEILEIREISVQMAEVVGGSGGVLGAGALAGLAAYGSVGLLGTASTGTAISGLSGVAATNATLAWFGGGSLAAGGLGIAGGTAVLGGIVAAPVLLVGGLILASKATEARENALSNLAKAEAAAAAMQNAEAAAYGIGRIADQIRKVIQGLRVHLDRDVHVLQHLVANNNDFRTYPDEDRKVVARCVSAAVTVKKLAETPLLEEDGAVTARIINTLRDSRKFLSEMKAK
ncbi:MAG: hypothetical protein OXF79_12450 [Chloroflexi bacterium]|nr:hypothetical protein [Chloroflexota bacterium]